jgi:hypothetical protein
VDAGHLVVLEPLLLSQRNRSWALGWVFAWSVLSLHHLWRWIRTLTTGGGSQMVDRHCAAIRSMEKLSLDGTPVCLVKVGFSWVLTQFKLRHQPRVSNLEALRCALGG